LSAGVLSVSASRGNAASSAPRRRHIEQLQSITCPISPSSSNAILPQWQLPWYFAMVRTSVDGPRGYRPPQAGAGASGPTGLLERPQPRSTLSDGPLAAGPMRERSSHQASPASSSHDRNQGHAGPTLPGGCVTGADASVPAGDEVAASASVASRSAARRRDGSASAAATWNHRSASSSRSRCQPS